MKRVRLKDSREKIGVWTAVVEGVGGPCAIAEDGISASGDRKGCLFEVTTAVKSPIR